VFFQSIPLLAPTAHSSPPSSRCARLRTSLLYTACVYSFLGSRQAYLLISLLVPPPPRLRMAPFFFPRPSPSSADLPSTHTGKGVLPPSTFASVIRFSCTSMWVMFSTMFSFLRDGVSPRAFFQFWSFLRPPPTKRRQPPRQLRIIAWPFFSPSPSQELSPSPPKSADASIALRSKDV